MTPRRSPVADWPANAVGFLIDAFALPFLFATALIARFLNRPYDVGLGPEPINSHPTHCAALRKHGYRARSYVHHVYYVTSRFDLVMSWPGPLRYFAHHALFAWAVLRCRCLFLSFAGGALGGTRLLWRIEPALYRVADVRTVMLPYGGDVQDMTRCPNLGFKHAMGQDYPNRRTLRAGIAARVDLWTRWSDHVVAGCDWVDYLHHWDSLMLLHFPVDTERFSATTEDPARSNPGTQHPLRVLHAPNHPHLKGTGALEQSVASLQAEGIAIELRILQGVPNDEIRRAMADADVIADQFVIGWYAMFALEGMAMGKPVLCHVRDDLERLYRRQGLLEADELPLVRCDVETITDALRRLATDPGWRSDVGKRSREFVLRRHALEPVGRQTAEILAGLGLQPRGGSEG